jgi:hypothetical protein
VSLPADRFLMTATRQLLRKSAHWDSQLPTTGQMFIRFARAWSLYLMGEKTK